MRLVRTRDNSYRKSPRFARREIEIYKSNSNLAQYMHDHYNQAITSNVGMCVRACACVCDKDDDIVVSEV